MNKEKILKTTKLISFILVVLGGINWLFIGLFECDIVGTLFGGTDSVVSRVIYSIIGLASLILLGIVLYKAFRKPAMKAVRTTAKKVENAAEKIGANAAKEEKASK